MEGQNTLLGTIYVQRQSGVTVSDEEIRDRLTQDIEIHLREQGFDVTPLIDLTVLNTPNSS